jgi:hypothetical protein
VTPGGKSVAMEYKAALRGVRNGQKRVLRLQRRLWLAELALWPTVILSVVLVAAGGWVLWQRKTRVRQAETATAAWAPVETPGPAPDPAAVEPAAGG